MKKRTRKMTTRERRERYMRSLSLTHLLIAVVALIECLLLVTFTTYSWIESSSSLIITSNNLDMAIAKNLAYQVCFSQESNQVVVLSGDPDEDSTLVTDAYYRSVLHFSFAKASSHNGKDFFFPYKYTTVVNETEQTVDRYRVGDTADYNTTYSYLDFELYNPGAERLLYFGPDTKFAIAGKETNSLDEDELAILDCMRISLQKNTDAPKIFSRTGDDVNAIASVESGVGTTGNTSVEAISDYTTGESVVVTSEIGTESNPTKDDISVRIWFEYQAYLDYRDTLSSDDAKAAFDAKVSATEIDCIFSLTAESIFNDYIYFDDYAFSVLDERRGHYLTDETDTYSMYFHAFNNDPTINAEENYPMTLVTGLNDIPEGARRWRALVSVEHVYNLLTSTSAEHFDDAYFYYGKADGSKIAYKWMLSDIGPLSVHIGTKTVEGHTLIDNAYLEKSTQVIRCLGAANYDSVQRVYSTGAYGAIEGYAEFAPYSDPSYTDPMTMISIKDKATGFTGADYNRGDSYQYITSSAGENPFYNSSAITSSANTPHDSYFNGLYYYDVPKTSANGSGTLQTIIFSNGGINGEAGADRQSENVNVSSIYNSELDGKLYSPNGSNNYANITIDANDTAHLATTFNLPLSNSSDSNKARVYFYNSVRQFTVYNTNWDYVYLYAMYSDGTNNSFPGARMTRVSDFAFTQTYDDLYINQIETSNGSTQKASAKKSIRPYYYIDYENSANNCFKAYVPSSWLAPTGNTHTYIHYNNGHYYDDSTDKIRFDIRTAQVTNTGTNEAPVNEYIYTMLGYSNAAAPAVTSFGGGTVGTGVGTWDETAKVRFDTELIDSSIFAANAYKLSYKDGNTWYDYPMAPVDGSYGMTFEAYLPTSCMTNSSSEHNSRFLRLCKDANNNDAYTINGYWYPQSSFSATDDTYYAVPTLVSGDSESIDTDSAVRGYFHVAVLNDSTYENLIYSIINDDLEPGSSLVYSFGSQTDTMAYVNTTPDPDVPVFANNTNGLPYLVPGSTRRWIIPIEASTTSITYTWTPYSGTTFTYTHNLADGIYYNISEGH